MLWLNPQDWMVKLEGRSSDSESEGLQIVVVWSQYESTNIEQWTIGYWVVSIDLFWPFFMPFLYNGVYFRPAQVSYTILPPNTHFECPKYLFTCSNTIILCEHLQRVNEQWTMGYGWGQNQDAKLKNVGGAMSLSNQQLYNGCNCATTFSIVLTSE